MSQDDGQLSFDLSTTPTPPTKLEQGSIETSASNSTRSVRQPTTPRQSNLPDQDARDAIVTERQRNLVISAGAGTGKTTMLVRRIVDLVAPASVDTNPIPIERIAAITFTRKAAGELRYRVREALLRAYGVAQAASDTTRSSLLYDALSKLDTSHIGTIHGFADRMLRLRPVEAELSPRYEVAEDHEPLVLETLGRLIRAAQFGSLKDDLESGDFDEDTLEEAADTLHAFIQIGVNLHRKVFKNIPQVSFRDLIEGFIETRDRNVRLPEQTRFDQEAMASAIALVRERIGDTPADGEGHRWLHRFVGQLDRANTHGSPADLCVAFARGFREGKKLSTKRRFFPHGGADWNLRQAIYDDKVPGNSLIPVELGRSLRAPHIWLGHQLVRLRPVVLAVYAHVKHERGVVDQVDLLLELRKVLTTRPAVRAFYRDQFDHILIDEFQDTDPLQVEIVFYLCEQLGETAPTWHDVKLRPGSLTVVGDPKQSIYRFRRADITIYERARSHILAGGGISYQLSTNFRSRPALLEVFNDSLAALLDSPYGGDSGKVPYEPLDPDPGAEVRDEPVVHCIPYAGESGIDLGGPSDGRPIEATAVAGYVRWLLASGMTIADPDTGMERDLLPSDIAILGAVTTNIPLLLRELDTWSIPYTARGGHLFLGHPVVRRTLLAVRALIDRDDGAALATLLAPPFFALEPADLYLERQARRQTDTGGVGGGAEVEQPGNGSMPAAGNDRADRIARVAEARAIISELRSTARQQAPGALMRSFIERTGLGRSVITGDNGRQMLGALYQLAFELDRMGIDAGYDIERATERLREWAELPGY